MDSEAQGINGVLIPAAALTSFVKINQHLQHSTHM